LTAEAPPLSGLKARRPFPARLGPKGNLIYKLVITTDHKLIGIMYNAACYTLFFAGRIAGFAGRCRCRPRCYGHRGGG
jgi:cytochrome c oxidase subunit 1